MKLNKISILTVIFISTAGNSFSADLIGYEHNVTSILVYEAHCSDKIRYSRKYMDELLALTAKLKESEGNAVIDSAIERATKASFLRIANIEFSHRSDRYCEEANIILEEIDRIRG